MLASKFHEVFGEDADFWGEHHEYTTEDWQYEVQNGDTRLGYWDWVLIHIEQDVEQKRQDIVDDWYDSCLNDRQFLRSILQDKANEMDDAMIGQAWEDAGLDGKED